jgi:hypothetical protein
MPVFFFGAKFLMLHHMPASQEEFSINWLLQPIFYFLRKKKLVQKNMPLV